MLRSHGVSKQCRATDIKSTHYTLRLNVGLGIRHAVPDVREISPVGVRARLFTRLTVYHTLENLCLCKDRHGQVDNTKIYRPMTATVHCERWKIADVC